MVVAFRWIIRNLLNLSIILVVLFSANWLHTKWNEAAAAKQQLELLRSERVTISNALLNSAQELEQQLRLGSTTDDGVKKLRDSVATNINAKKAERDQLTKDSPLVVLVPTTAEFRRMAVLNMEISMLEEAQTKAKELANLIGDVADGKNQLTALKWQKYRADTAVYQNRFEDWQIRQNHPVAILIPFTWPSMRLQKLAGDLPALQKDVTDTQVRIVSLDYVVSLTERRLGQARGTFMVGHGAFEKAVAEIDARIERDGRVVADSFFASLQENFWPTVRGKLPTAIGILLSLILVPIGIKIFFYYVVAPWASRQEPICILPDATMHSSVAGRTDQLGIELTAAGISVPVTLDEDEELLLHADYVQSSSSESRKNTVWVLNWGYLLASLAADMYALTRIRPYKTEPTVVSSSAVASTEIGVIEVSDGAALVFHPRCLVGVIQKQDRPLRITSHWRLGHLHSWLTLQLRHLVFHGPAKLIVKGCRGVRLELANDGRLINQAATLGFSAGLKYSVARCETFVPYWRGEQELFNDRFAGPSGVYIYEETPSLNRKAGVTGRGLEGFADAVLKVFGI